MVLTIFGGEIITENRLREIATAIIHEKDGRAYGFFNCEASKERIESDLPESRRLSLTPSELELSLTEGMENVRGDERIVQLAREYDTWSREEIGSESNARYMLEARYPNASNKKTADELATILTNLWLQPYFTSRKPARAVVYEENGEFVFID